MRLITLACLSFILTTTPITFAAPAPPRHRSTPQMAPVQSRSHQPVESDQTAFQPPEHKTYQATPLSQIITLHEKKQPINAAGIENLAVQEMTHVLRDGYLAHGSRNEKWDAPMLAAIDEALYCRSIGATFPQRQKLMHMLRAVARQKCDDARYYYMFAYARLYYRSQDVLDALRTASEIAEKDPEHNRHLLWLVNLRLSTHLRIWNKHQEAGEARGRARTYFVQWLEHDFKTIDPLLVYDWIDSFKSLAVPLKNNPGDETEVQKFIDAVLRIEHLEPWVPPVLQATIAIRAAWRARGGGWASTVTDQGWVIWVQQNKIAYEYALKAHKLNPLQPFAATLLIELCWASDESQGQEYSSRYWFEQAVAAMIDYKPAYTSYAWGIMPRWGGSTTMLLQFAKECADTNRYDTPIPFYTMNVLRNVRLDFPEDELRPKPLALTLAHQFENVFTHYLENEKDPQQRKRLVQYWLLWTVSLDLPEQAAIVSKKLDAPYDPTEIYPHYFLVHNITRYAMETFIARSKPQGDKLTQAIRIEKYQPDNAMEAYHIYADLLSDHDNNNDNKIAIDPAITRYARDRIQIKKWQTAYDNNEWVDLEFTPDLTGFNQLSGKWEQIDQHTVQGTTDDLPARILPMLESGKYFEMEITLNFIHKPKGPPLMAGLVYAHLTQPVLYREYGLYIRQQPGSIWADLAFYEPYRMTNLPIPQKVTATFTVKHRYMTITIDGKQTIEPRWIGYTPTYYIPAIGTAFENAPGSIVQYSNIKIHKLPEPEKKKED